MSGWSNIEDGKQVRYLSFPLKTGKKLLIVVVAWYVLKGIVVTAVLLWALIF
jgi:hypothetical protein